MSTQEPHLVVLTMDFAPEIGGVQNYLYEISRRLGKVIRTTIITPVTGELREVAPFVRLEPQPQNVYGYWRSLKQLEATHVLVGHVHPQLLIAAWLVRPAKLAAVANGNDFLAAQRRWHRAITNGLLGQTRPLITHSASNSIRLKALGLSKVEVVQPGTDPTQFFPSDDAKSRPPALLSVCRLVSRKGIDTVINALPTLLSDFPQLTYVVVGDGPDKTRLKSLVSAKGLRDNVRFLGRVSDDMLPDIYRQADVFVMPVRDESESASIEGFGIVYLEASASGLPVIAGNSGGAAEAVKDGETGFVVEPNTEAVTVALLRLLGDEDLRRDMGRSGRHWVEAEMNWDRTASEMAMVLNVAGP